MLMTTKQEIETSAKKQFWTRPPVVFLAALFCCVLWGSASPAIKIAYRLFAIDVSDTASRLLLAGTRFTISGIMIIAFGSLLNGRFLKPKRTSWGKICVLAMLQTVLQYYFFFMSLANTSGVRASIINASGNFLAILTAAYLFHLEAMTPRKWIGCIVGFAGIVLLIGGSNAITADGISLAGEGAMLAADIFYAVSGCLIKIYSQDEDPVVLSGYQFFLGGIVLSLIGFLSGGKLVFQSGSCYLILLYLCFISAGAYTVWGILLKYNPVSRVSILGFMNPVMGVLLSALFLHENQEAFSLTGLCALLLVSLGIIIVNRSGTKKSN